MHIEIWCKQIYTKKSKYKIDVISYLAKNSCKNI